MGEEHTNPSQKEKKSQWPSQGCGNMCEHVCATQMCTSGQLHHPHQAALVYPCNAKESIQGTQGCGRGPSPQNSVVWEGLRCPGWGHPGVLSRVRGLGMILTPKFQDPGEPKDGDGAHRGVGGTLSPKSRSSGESLEFCADLHYTIQRPKGAPKGLGGFSPQNPETQVRIREIWMGQEGPTKIKDPRSLGGTWRVWGGGHPGGLCSAAAPPCTRARPRACTHTHVHGHTHTCSASIWSHT